MITQHWRYETAASPKVVEERGAGTGSPGRLALHVPVFKGSGLVLCGSRCKTGEMVEVSLGKHSKMMSIKPLFGRLGREHLVTQASRALCVAEHLLSGPFTGVTVRRDFRVFTGTLQQARCL